MINSSYFSSRIKEEIWEIEGSKINAVEEKGIDIDLKIRDILSLKLDQFFLGITPQFQLRKGWKGLITKPIKKEYSY